MKFVGAGLVPALNNYMGRYPGQPQVLPLQTEKDPLIVKLLRGQLYYKA